MIDSVAVAPNQQGKGLGKQLLHFAETLASQAGHDLIWLYANKVMLNNIQLYKGLGYRVYNRRTENGYDRIFMRKHLGRFS